MTVNEKFAILSALAKSKEYDISIAGLTIKGIGVYSAKITVGTNEAGTSMYSQ